MISDEMEGKFNERLAEVMKSTSSICLEYTFERGFASVAMFNKLVSRFARSFRIEDSGAPGGKIEMAFAQKVEKRSLPVTAGMFGVLRQSTEKKVIHFLIHEYEKVHDQLAREGKKEKLAHPVHRGIRIFLQQEDGSSPLKNFLRRLQCNSEADFQKLYEIMKEFHVDFSADMEPKDASPKPTVTLPRLICPTCLQSGNECEGFFRLNSHLAIESDFPMCSTSHHDLPKGIRNMFSEKKDREDRTDSSIQAQNINEGSKKTVIL